MTKMRWASTTVMQAVRDHYCRSPAAKTLDRPLHLFAPTRTSSEAVASSSRMTVRVLEQCARHRNALALTAGDRMPCSPTGVIVSARKGHDEVVRIGRFGGGDDLGLGRAGAAERDVLAH